MAIPQSPNFSMQISLFIGQQKEHTENSISEPSFVIGTYTMSYGPISLPLRHSDFLLFIILAFIVENIFTPNSAASLARSL